ncbi:hypothetical protein CI610_02867 [invertebrate metagenome]|uniref:Reverse transcriptase domain-containing protein n=1 Tax=invertebrate metagenome TaxID=1711999 RepID=A0A2H9T4N9_9ZZZZ
MTIEGFHAPFRRDRNYAGGGILVYVKNLLNVTRLHHLENPEDETVWVQINLKNYSIIVCTAYRPEHSTAIFWEHLRASLSTAFDLCSNVIVTGDLNVDLLTVQPTHIFCDIINSFSLVNVINEPTRFGQTRNTLLDPILLSDSLSSSISSTVAIDRNISDHDGCMTSIKVPGIISPSYIRKVWIYRRADFYRFNNLLSEYNWENMISNCDSVDLACDRFTDLFLQFANQCIPSKEVSIRPNDKPWMNSEIRKNIRFRDRLYKKAKTTKRDPDIRKYKDQRNKVNNMKKNARLIFYENVHGLIDEYYSSDPKSYWRLVKRLMKSNMSTEQIPTLIDTDSNSLATTDSEKANLLNKYFCGITSLDDSEHVLPFFPSRTNNTLSNIIVTQSEVKDVLKILKLGKASGHDGISHHMLKYTVESVCIPLTLLFNLSLSTCVYPDVWKTANVMPLFKKNDRYSVTNYRPISLLSTVGKVFERVVYKHMHNFMLENSLFYQYQSGFMPGHSTVFQLIELYHNICLALEEKKHTCIIFCDISKAFDRVWHRGLITKLKSYGFTGELIKWLENYLSNRKQKVFINNSFSSLSTIKAGVPQGSILGPLLFLIYINDIADFLESVSRLFADDTSLLVSSHSCQEIEQILNRDLEVLNTWAKTWLVTFNPNKTEMIFISNSNEIEADLDIVFDGIFVNFTETHRHLGVLISSSAKWGDHVNSIYKSAMKKINMLRKLKFILKRDALLRIYKTFILPILEYACELWDGCSISDSIKLELVQREAARIITGLPSYVNVSALYSETSLETLSERRKRRKLSLFYKMDRNLTPHYLNSLLPPNVGDTNNYILRTNNNYRIPHYRLSLTTSSFIPSSLHMWNDLDESTRSSPSLATFKKSISRSDEDKYPTFYNFGDRKTNIIHTKLRHRCSALNYDLFRVNLINSPDCSCGNRCESAYHYFFECENYVNCRGILFDNLRNLNINITLNALLYGNNLYADNVNLNIFRHVHYFIKSSKRF